MARPRLRRPDQPWPVRFLLGLYEALASLRLAVVVIAASAVVLGWATWVESRYGTEAVQFGIYRTRWFAALMAVLGANVLCAALIRFPWKKSQTGFLITHAGILVLLVGCLLTSLKGIDAQLPVFEGQTAHLAFEDSQHFELEIYRESAAGLAREGRDSATGPTAAPDPAAGPAAGPDAQTESSAETIRVPFAPGPFNWDDYGSRSVVRLPGRDDDTLFWFPWRLARRDHGVLYDRDGIRLEVLDYYSDSRIESAPPLKLRVRGPEGPWTSVEMQGRGVQDPGSPHGRFSGMARKSLADGRWIVFWTAGSRAETEAFLQSRPEGPLEKRGQVVLYAGGKSYRFSVDELEQQRRKAIGRTGMEVELDHLEPGLPRVRLRVHHPGASPRLMRVYAEMPELNQHDEEHGVFGTYWFDTAHAAEKIEIEGLDARRLQTLRRPRIDVIQGADRKLYFRTWASPELGTVAELPGDGTRIAAFAESESPITLYVEQFIPHDRPGVMIKPAPFSKGKYKKSKLRQARVRLSVDGNAAEFWLEGLPASPLSRPPEQGQRKLVHGRRRRVAVTLPWDQIDVGFQLYLHDFQRKLDPGSSRPSYYSSLVDLLDHRDSSKRLQTEVLITLNEPATFTDQRTGRSYRVYQEDFWPKERPLKPGDLLFDELVESDSPRDELFLSWLTVNYDPGRGLKYLGSLLITAGIATVFYMRAYFFRRRSPVQAA